MTLNDSVELLFRARAEGAPELDRLADAAQRISGSSAQALTNLTGLEQAMGALTTAVSANTAALEAHFEEVERLSGSYRRTGESAKHAVTDMQAASAAIRGLEGSMNIRAAERFISMFQGLGPILQGAFPIFGALALFNVMEKLVEHTGLLGKAWDPVKEAQKDSLHILQQTSREYDSIIEKIKRLKYDEYERVNGRQARQRLEAEDLDAQAGGRDHQQIVRLQAEAEALRRIAGGSTGTIAFSGDPTIGAAGTRLGGTRLGSLDAYYGGLAGVAGLSAGQILTPEQIATAKTVLPQIEAQLRVAHATQELDRAESSDLKAKAAAEDRKEADKEALRLQRELEQAERQAAAYLRQAQTFELTGLERINAEYREKLNLLGKTPKAIEDINAAYAIEVAREVERANKEGVKKLDSYRGWWQEHGSLDEATGAFHQNAGHIPSKIRLTGYGESQEKADREFVDAGLKLLLGEDAMDADAVRRSTSTGVRLNNIAVSAGRMSGQSAATSDYAQRVAAANQIFEIETRRLDLIDDESRRAEKLAQAKKKWADEIYRAEEQYEVQLQALREKDLHKYQTLAGGLFDAMQSHSVSDWLRQQFMGQARQVFVNATAPTLQSAGHALAGLIPGQAGTALGGMLNNTWLDPKNAGVTDAATTAKETKRTADEVFALRADIRALGGAPAATPGAGTGGADISGLSGLAGTTSRALSPWLSIFGSDTNGLTGQGGLTGASALFRAGSGSIFGQFFSGLTGAGSSPLGAIFGGYSTNGNTQTELTGAQRAGAAVGTGAALATAGYGIVQGIQRGGVGGYSQAIAAGAGAAALLDPEPISKAVLTGVAAVAGIFGSAFGNSKEKRSRDLTNELSSNAFLPPTALNLIQSMDGTYGDFDARGNYRTSSLNALPTVAQPYITSRVIDGQRGYYDAPGYVAAPYSGNPRGDGRAPISNTYIIHAVDAESFHSFLRQPKNAHSVGEALADHLERHEGRASNAIRYVTGA